MERELNLIRGGRDGEPEESELIQRILTKEITAGEALETVRPWSGPRRRWPALRLVAAFAMAGCSSTAKAPSGEPFAFPIAVSDGDELLLECYKGSEKAVIPLEVPDSVKRAESIVYFVNEEWRCQITRKRK